MNYTQKKSHVSGAESFPEPIGQKQLYLVDRTERQTQACETEPTMLPKRRVFNHKHRNMDKVYIQVKQSRYRPGVAHRFPGI